MRSDVKELNRLPSFTLFCFRKYHFWCTFVRGVRLTESWFWTCLLYGKLRYIRSADLPCTSRRCQCVSVLGRFHYIWKKRIANLSNPIWKYKQLLNVLCRSTIKLQLTNQVLVHFFWSSGLNRMVETGVVKDAYLERCCFRNRISWFLMLSLIILMIRNDWVFMVLLS